MRSPRATFFHYLARHRLQLVAGVCLAAGSSLAAVVFSLEPVWTGFFGFVLAGDRLGALGWGGCAVIMGGIVLAEPAAARALARLVRRPRVT